MAFLETRYESVALLSATASGAGASIKQSSVYSTYQAVSDGSHSGTTVINIEVSNDDSSWIVMGTLSVSGANDIDGISSNAGWLFVRANCTAHGDSTNVVTVRKGG